MNNNHFTDTHQITNTSDTSEHVDLISTIANSHYQQLEGGVYNGNIQRLEVGDITLFSEHSNCSILKNGMLNKELCTISFLSEKVQGWRMSQFKIQQSTVAFLPGDVEFEVQTQANSRGIFFVLEQQMLLEAAEREGHRLTENYQDINMVEAAATHPLFDLPNTLIHTLNANSQTQEYLNRLILDFILDVLTTTHNEQLIKPPTTLSRAYAITRRGRNFIEQNITRPLTIHEICNAIGTSRRALQYAFNTVFGINPVSYLRVVRLNRARQALLSKGAENTNVTSTAMNWGFVHLGRFAQDYKRLFGESPSMSLSRPYKTKDI